MDPVHATRIERPSARPAAAAPDASSEPGSDPGSDASLARSASVRVIRPASAPASQYPRSAGLPPDLLQEAVRRLGYFAGATTVAGIASLLVPLIVPSIQLGHPEVRVPVQLAFALFSGALAWCATHERLPLARVLDVALVYQVLGCAALAIVVNSRPWPTELMAGWSPVAVLVLFAPIVIPSTTLRTTITAILAASTDPLATFAHAHFAGIDLPSSEAMIFRFFPNVIAIPIAILVSRGVHGLGARLAQARELGSYRLLDKLGSGGMGEVWRAAHRQMTREAAVKLIRADMLEGTASDAAAAVARFEREARAIAALRSPHTVQLYDAGTANDGTLYYVMELLDGIDLQTLVDKHGRLPPERVVHLLRQVCHSLREAHDARLIHRDVKPANVLLCHYGGDFDHVKVLDFGLVRELTAAVASPNVLVSGDGRIAGTPAYLAPESATGARPVDARTDLYGVGCLAYFLLTGMLVFDASAPMEMAIAHATQPPRPPSERAGVAIPRELEALVMRCLEKDPDRRPASARALDAMLAAVPLAEPWTEARARAWWAEHRRLA
jgi:hypothetical protein